MGAKRTPDDVLDCCHMCGRRILKHGSTCGGNALWERKGHRMTCLTAVTCVAKEFRSKVQLAEETPYGSGKDTG